MRSKKLFILPVLLLIFSAVACNLPFAAPQEGIAIGPQPVSQWDMVTADPNATGTPTPFQPIAPTQSFVPTDMPPTPTLNPTQIVEVPLSQRYPKPKGQVNILILGSDYRPGGGYRTDVIVLCSINPDKGTVSLVSFPRDLWLDIPTIGPQRINTAMALGNFDILAQTFEENFGVRPDHYIMTNFNGFVGIIDSLGGVDVYAEYNLTDTCDLPQAVNHYCSVGPGQIHMNGATALWYARSRYSTNDFDRERRAQEVLKAIFWKFLSLDAVSRAPELYDLYRSSVDTDLTLNDILPLVPMLKVLNDDSLIQRYTVGPEQVTPWVTNGGAMVLLPNQEAIWEIIRKAVYDQP